MQIKYKKVCKVYKYYTRSIEEYRDKNKWFAQAQRTY